MRRWKKIVLGAILAGGVAVYSNTDKIAEWLSNDAPVVSVIAKNKAEERFVQEALKVLKEKLYIEIHRLPEFEKNIVERVTTEDERVAVLTEAILDAIHLEFENGSIVFDYYKWGGWFHKSLGLRILWNERELVILRIHPSGIVEKVIEGTGIKDFEEFIAEKASRQLKLHVKNKTTIKDVVGSGLKSMFENLIIGQ